MRVTYFTNAYPAVSHTFIKREILALERLGYEVQRVTIRPAAGLVDEEDRAEAAKTVALASLPRARAASLLLRRFVRRPAASLAAIRFGLRVARRSGISRGKMIAYILEAALLAELCDRHGSRLLRVHFGTNGATVARLCRRMGGPPYSIAYHGPDDFDAPVKWDVAGVIDESAFVTAISRFCTAQLRRWAPPEQWDKIAIVRCGVDERFLTPAPLPTRHPRRLCTIARIAPPKGLPVLIDAIAEASAKGAQVELEVVGDGPLRPGLERRCRDLGIEGLVRFHGALSGEDVRRVIAGCSGMVVASFAEGVPVVLMEAMGMGRPAIATRIMGIPELVVDGQSGWLVTPADLSDLVRAIMAFDAATDEELSRMGTAAHRAVLATHTVRGQADILDTVIRTFA
jgi:glycosyltransferase involved in cell wall biosynthesis